MGKFIENMNDFTAKLFCSPVDAETAKSEVKLNLSFAKTWGQTEFNYLREFGRAGEP